MSRISIDVTDAEHQRLKAMAALQGKTIKEFVLSSTLGTARPGSDADQALKELEALVDERVRETREKGVSNLTVGEIFTEGIAESGRGPDS